MNNFLLPKFLKEKLNLEDINQYNKKLIYYYFLDGIKANKEAKKKELLEKFISFTFNELNEYKKRQKGLIEDFSKLNYKYEIIEATLKSHCIPGFGLSSSFETGINLHFLYGFPYISSTSIKGVTSDYAILFQGKNFQDSDYKKVFGSEKNKGEVIFLDALPKSSNNLFTLDVMTPHYQDYYIDKEPPGDYLKPIPIVFLVIKKGIIFEFPILSKELNVLSNAKNWLIKALNEIGVGSKTSVGYGIFKDIKYKNKI